MSLRLSVLPLASLLAIAVSTAPLTAKPRGNISPPSAGAGAEIVEGEVLFVFAGGSPRDFITQVQETFPFLRWADVLTIPEAEFRDVRVPEIRARVHTPAQLLRLYNGLAQTQPELGRWAIVQGDNPEAWSEREEDFSSERPVAA